MAKSGPSGPWTGKWTPTGKQKFQLREKRLRSTAEKFENWGVFLLVLTVIGALIFAWSLSSTCFEAFGIERCEADMGLFWGLAVGLAVADVIVLVPLYFGTAKILEGLADAQYGFYSLEQGLSQADE